MEEFLTGYALPVGIILAQILAIVVPLLVAVAYLTYAERKVIGAIQLRQGPNIVGAFGLLQPLADGAKLLFKETILPAGANRVVFLLAPILTFSLAMVAWSVIPVNEGWAIADINVGILFLFAISSMGVYGVIMAGWASNSKYPFLGALRSAAQMVSYEVSMGFVIITVLLCVGSLNLTDIVLAQETVWFAIPLLPMFVIFFISTLAETNRAPFDLPEGVGTCGRLFRRVFGDELRALLPGRIRQHDPHERDDDHSLPGGWLPPLDIVPLTWIPGPIWFALKVALVLFCFLWVRATFPRYRYDQLMRLGWKVFLPFTLVWLVLTAGVLVTFDWLPR
ncbi:complex I subunit 1/NuoH family protein [Fodinicurvata halophila]